MDKALTSRIEANRKEYENGGRIEVYKIVDKKTHDYEKIYACCDYFAKQGEKTIITPHVHYKDPLYKEVYGKLIGTKYERMCPDFKVGSNFYEHEGFDVNMNSDPKRTFGNMISRGVRQSDRIVIDDCGVTHRWAKRNIQVRVSSGAKINEVWILEKNGLLTRLY